MKASQRRRRPKIAIRKTEFKPSKTNKKFSLLNFSDIQTPQTYTQKGGIADGDDFWTNTIKNKNFKIGQNFQKMLNFQRLSRRRFPGGGGAVFGRQIKAPGDFIIFGEKVYPGPAGRLEKGASLEKKSCWLDPPDMVTSSLENPWMTTYTKIQRMQVK